MEGSAKNEPRNDSQPPMDKWEKIGYHRVIGGFYFYIIFAVVAVGYVLLLPVFIPYPESMGFYNILTGIFSSFFTFADLGTASSLARFIAEYRVKDPQRCMEYIRFFIWFQMFTGLGQTTVDGRVAIVDEFFHDYISTFNRVFIIVLIHRTIFQHSHLMNEVLIGTGHHKFNVLITVIEQIVGMTAILTCIYYQLGIFILIIPGYLSTAAKQGLGWVYITTRIIPLHFRKAAWQNWISTAMAGFVYYGVIQGVFALLGLVIPVAYAAIAVVVLGIYVLPGVGYFFPLGLLGGYDKNTIEDFKNAVALAGPSKPIVVPWYKCAALAARISPLHDKFPMHHDHVSEEIEELMAMKVKVDSSKLQ